MPAAGHAGGDGLLPRPRRIGQENVMKIRETVTGKRLKAALAGATIAVFLGVTGLVTVYAQGALGQITRS